MRMRNVSGMSAVWFWTWMRLGGLGGGSIWDVAVFRPFRVFGKEGDLVSGVLAWAGFLNALRRYYKLENCDVFWRMERWNPEGGGAVE